MKHGEPLLDIWEEEEGVVVDHVQEHVDVNGQPYRVGRAEARVLEAQSQHVGDIAPLHRPSRDLLYRIGVSAFVYAYDKGILAVAVDISPLGGSRVVRILAVPGGRLEASKLRVVPEHGLQTGRLLHSVAVEHLAEDNPLSQDGGGVA